MRPAGRIAVVAGVTAVAVAGAVVASGLLDRTGPTVELSWLPDGPVRGVLGLSLVLDDEAPGLGGFTAWIDEEPAELQWDGKLASLDLSGVADGPHTLRITAWDSAWTPNFTRAEWPLDVDQTPPALDITAGSLAATQGRALPVFVRTDEPATAVSATLLDQDVELVDLGGGTLWRGLFGVELRAPEGPASLSLSAADAAGNTAHLEATVTVDSGRFSRGGTIRLRPDQVAARKDEEAKARMREQRSDAYAWPSQEQLWSGAMQRPLDEGRISSPFGRYRAYSDGRKSHHTGTDLAAATGTPVRAAAAGEVRFAGEQAIFGNVVIVHHGQGLATSYNHLSRIDASQGQRVARGEVVGAVGSTGQSTGPHLHWGVTVHAVAVDGMPLLEEDLELPREAEWVALTP